MKTQSPRAPFTRWPIQDHDPDYGFFWWLDRATFVSQSAVPRFTLGCAQSIHARVDRLLATRKDDVAREHGLLIIHDWRSIEAYDREARQEFLDRSRARGRGYLRRSVVAVHANPLLRMALQSGCMLVSVFLGVPIDVMGDPTPVVGELGLVPPRAGTAFP